MAERSTRVGTTGTASTSGGADTGAHSTAEMLRAGKEEAVDQTKAMVRDMADQQRRKAAESLSGMAQALHRSARDLETENGMMARYTDVAAQQLDRVSSYLRQSDWNDIVHGAENIARRQPYWFVGGAVAAGFLLARFLKSSGGVEAAEEAGIGRRSRSESAYAPGSAAAPGYGGATTTPYTTTGSGIGVTVTSPASSGDLP